MALFVSLLCLVALAVLLLQFLPQASLAITHVEPQHDGLLRLTITIANTSRGRLTKHTILLQALAYKKSQVPLPDTVPFSSSSVRSGEEPLEWHEPREILRELQSLAPGEQLVTEYLVRRPENAELMHIGLQFNAAQGPVQNLIGRFFPCKTRWETVSFHIPHTLR